MIFYSVYIVVIMLQLVLGYPISSSNNQDVAVTNLIPRGSCFSIILPQTVLDTPLAEDLQRTIPNTPENYELLGENTLIDSPTIHYRALRTAPPPNAIP